MPESEIAIKCSGRRYMLLVNSEEFYLCYCEWLFAITTRNNPLLHREIIVSLNIEKLILT